MKPDKISKKALQFIKNKKICIVKPVSVSKGIGIFLVKSENELKKNYWKIKKTYTQTQRNLKNQNKIYWVLQEYINEPLLYKKHKFHIRTYYIVTSEGEHYVSRKGILMIAKKKYKKDNYEDKDIHDTHYNKEKKEVIFGEDKLDGFTDKEYKKMQKDIIEIHKTFISKLSIICYNNVDFCFQILGVDVMFTKDYQIKVLEINKSPQIINYKFPICSYLFEGIMQEIVDKKYPPKIKQTKNNHLIKLN